MTIGRVGVYYDDQAIPADRIHRAKQIRLAESVQSKHSEFLRIAGLMSGSGHDVLWVKLTAFRLPRGARWFTGGMNGNDQLAAMVSADRASKALYSNEFAAQLGAGDRTIGANYSANRAMKELVDSLAWEIAWDLSWVTGRRQEENLLDAGERARVKRAILVQAHRGQLSYGEFSKHALAGRVGVENTGLSAKYDACGLRRVFTLGLSRCEWDPDYR